MKEKFYEGYEKHDFKPIYDTIAAYYPVGQVLTEEEYRTYPGLMKLGELINENFFNQTNYRNRWVKFKKFLKQEIKKSVVETMVAFYPCYSGEVNVKATKLKDYIVTKKLHFFISLLGPYYSIFAADESILYLEYTNNISGGNKVNQVAYPALHAITVSPDLEYSEIFQLLKEKIEEYFPEYRLIPYHIHQMKVPGIFSPNYLAERESETVFSALFNPGIHFHSAVRGDEHYNWDEWLAEGKIDVARKSEIKEKLSENSKVNYDANTIHKVWKLKRESRIPHPEKLLLLRKEQPQIMDFTDKSNALLVFNKNKEPDTSTYNITEQTLVIHSFENRLGFKITHLSQKELVLELTVKIPLDGGIKMNGPRFELVYGRYS